MAIGLPIPPRAPYTCDVAESSCSLVLVNATPEHIDYKSMEGFSPSRHEREVSRKEILSFPSGDILSIMLFNIKNKSAEK